MSGYLVPTRVAAIATGVGADQLEAWANAKMITPVRVDPRRGRLWELDDRFLRQVRQCVGQDTDE